MSVEMLIKIYVTYTRQNTHLIFCHLGSQKGANLYIQCTKMRLAAGLRTRWSPNANALPETPKSQSGGLLLRGEGAEEMEVMGRGGEEMNGKGKRRTESLTPLNPH